MPRLHWTPKAHEDLDAIKRYIEDDDPEAAVRVVLGIIERAEQLRDFPESGPLQREKRWQRDTMRFLTVESFLIFYKVDAEFVSIIRVLPAARDYRSVLY